MLLIVDIWPDSNPSFLDDLNFSFDGITLWGNMWHNLGSNNILYEEYMNKYISFWRKWSSLAQGHGLHFIPTIYPGFDDRPAVDAGIIKEHHYIQRDSERFRHLLEFVKEITTPPLNIIILFSFNDFHEGNSIEPTKEYGFTYLDIIRKVFVKDYIVKNTHHL